jgi:protein-disulfide isomerase
VVAITYAPENATGEGVYFLTDPLCPCCNKAGKQLKAIADETGVTFKVVYANVHGAKGEAKIKESICSGYDFEQYNADEWKSLPSTNNVCLEADLLWNRTQQVVGKLGLKGVPAFVTDSGEFVSGANMPALKKAIASMQADGMHAKVD